MLGTSQRQQQVEDNLKLHLRRRYQVASSFLLDAADKYLLLNEKEDTDNKEFLQGLLLPMLQQVVPPPMTTTTTATTTTTQSTSTTTTTSIKPVKRAKKLAKKLMLGKGTSLSVSFDDEHENTRMVTIWNGTNEIVRDELLRLSSSKSSNSNSSNTIALQCLCMLLFQYLLQGTSGYDARIRHSIKKLGTFVFLLQQDDRVGRNSNTGRSSSDDDGEVNDDDDNSNDDTTTTTTSVPSYQISQATRKFESLEQFLATRLLALAQQGKDNATKDGTNSNNESTGQKRGGISRDQWVRGLKVGTVGVLAGTLLAVTGGLAAPGIAAGLTVLGMGAVATTFLSLASMTAVLSLFGAAGGSLAMYKMNRRTEGLTEFEFLSQNEQDGKIETDHQLSRTVCISGWLRDLLDFERPWGVTPTQPPLTDELELLERFYSIYNPNMVPLAKDILSKYKNDTDTLWKLLKEKYNACPTDPLFTTTGMDDFLDTNSKLNSQEEHILDQLIVKIGEIGGSKKNDKNASKKAKPSTSTESSSSPSSKLGLLSSSVGSKSSSGSNTFSKMGKGLMSKWGGGRSGSGSNVANEGNEEDQQQSSSTISTAEQAQSPPTKKGKPSTSPFNRFGQIAAGFGNQNPSNTEGSNNEKVVNTAASVSDLEKLESLDITTTKNSTDGGNENNQSSYPKHLATVWDYRARYGGELYTVKWESQVLMGLCTSVRKLAYELASSAGKEALKQTVAATLILAAIIPTAIYNVVNNLDDDWTLVIQRSDEAGKELARCLLSSSAGRRPVTLVGYSFGARAIYSCLRELYKYQEVWEMRRRNNSSGSQQQRKLGRRSTSTGSNNDDGSFEFDVEPTSVLEDVVLMGMPAHLDLEAWKECRQVVAGRLVNVYSRTDRILSIMFKYKRIMGGLNPVCGTCTVAVPGVENVDVTDILSGGHADYCLYVGSILQRIRHGQPIRSSSNAIDELALIAEVEKMNLVPEEEEVTPQS